MKRKRLTREGWGFQRFPYYQMRVDTEAFHGLLAMIELTRGETCCWHMPRAGKAPVCGAGMTWLQLVPDGADCMLTCKFLPNDRVSVWYADAIDRIEYDADGVAAFADLYLDVIFTPQGDVKVDDRDELDAAREEGLVTDAQYRRALAAGERILRTACRDLKGTEQGCRRLLAHARSRMNDPDVLALNTMNR